MVMYAELSSGIAEGDNGVKAGATHSPGAYGLATDRKEPMRPCLSVLLALSLLMLVLPPPTLAVLSDPASPPASPPAGAHDADYDAGPIILQRCLPIEEHDTPASLGARVFAAECEAYPEAISLFSAARLEIDNGRVRVIGPSTR